jgi:uncharacterized protein YutE (UPF0331/DUF86 family)
MHSLLHQAAIVLWLEPPFVVDSERLSRALRDLERSVNFMEQILNRPLDEFLNDDEAVYALRYAVIEAVETAVQIGLILLRETGARPTSFGEVFQMLGERGIIPRDLAAAMRRFAGLRNLLVHRYWDVDDAMLYRELKEEGLETLRRFMRHVH